LLTDLISEPYFIFLLFFIFAPPVVAALLIVKPLRKLLDGVILVSLVVPLTVTFVVVPLLAFCFSLSADTFFKFKSVKKLLFGSEFSRFQDDFHNVPFNNLEEQFGPFSYNGLRENPCFLDRYSEETLGTVHNALLGGGQKIACYAEWKSTDDQNSQLAKLIEKSLNENFSLIRNDLLLESLDKLSLLEIPKMITTRKGFTRGTDKDCYAKVKYNVETFFHGTPIGISITDYYDFSQINANEVTLSWDASKLQGRSCNSHCFTRKFNIDFSEITTPLDYYEFARQYFDQNVEKEIFPSDEIDSYADLLHRPGSDGRDVIQAEFRAKFSKKLASSYSF
jgi:hypothetical protein